MYFYPQDGKFSRGIVDSLNRYDLWTQHYSIEDPSGLRIKFQAYYSGKDPARSLSATADRVGWTTDFCKENPGQSFCAEFEANGQPDWASSGSPFRGALRAVNFKRLAIYQIDPADPESLCSDAHGKNPQLPSTSGSSCPANLIEQKMAKKFEQNALHLLNTQKCCLNYRVNTARAIVRSG